MNNEMELILNELVQQGHQDVLDDANNIISTLEAEPRDLEELDQIKTFVEEKYEGRREGLYSMLMTFLDKEKLMEQFFIKQQFEDIVRSWECVSMPKACYQEFVGCKKMIRRKQKEFAEDLKNDQLDLLCECENIAEQLDELKLKDDLE